MHEIDPNEEPESLALTNRWLIAIGGFLAAVALSSLVTAPGAGVKSVAPSSVQVSGNPSWNALEVIRGNEFTNSIQSADTARGNLFQIPAR